MTKLDFIDYLYDQCDWSLNTFGPGNRTKMVLDHIKKELIEIENDPLDLEEWVDLIMLSIDGAWRIGASPEKIVAALQTKLNKNKNRKWPDWRTADPDKAIEHVRE